MAKTKFASHLVIFAIAFGMCRGVASAGTKAIPAPLLSAERGLERQVAEGFGERFRWSREDPWKEAVDDSLLPIFLLRELGAKRPGLLCRTLAYDYSGMAAPKMLCNAGTQLRMARMLSPMRLRSHRCVRFRLLAGNAFGVGYQMPVLLCWRGVLGRNRGVARISWCEPALCGQFSLAYPDTVSNTGLFWNRKYSIDETRPGAGYSPPYKSVFKKGGPIMDVAWGVYSESHALALWPVVRLPTVLNASLDTADTGPSMLLTGPTNWNNGRDRREVFSSHAGALTRVEIQQPEVETLRHEQDSPSNLYYSVHGIQKAKKFWPGALVPYLRRGREISVTFAPKPGERGSYPKTITIRKDGVLRFVGRYLSLKYFSGPVPASPWADETPANRGGTPYLGRNIKQSESGFYSRKSLSFGLGGRLLRERIRFNAYRAVRRKNWRVLRRTLEIYRRLLRREDIPYVYYVFSIEGLTNWASRFDHSGRVRALTSDFLVPAFQKLPPTQIARHVALCVNEYKYGFAVAALSALSRDSTASRRLREWSQLASKRILTLIHKIQSRPVLYRRYAATNRYWGWNHTTKMNELLASYLNIPAVAGDAVHKEKQNK